MDAELTDPSGPPDDAGLPDDIYDYLNANRYTVDCDGFLSSRATREDFLRDGCVRVLLEEPSDPPHPEIPPGRRWAGVLTLPDNATYVFVVDEFPNVSQEGGQYLDGTPVPHVTWFSILHAGVRWEDLPSRLASIVERARLA